MRSMTFVYLLLAATALEAAPKTDPYGDPLPDGAVSRIGTMRLLHDDSLGWADFSADGKRLVTGGMYGERRLHVWDPRTGKRVALLPTKEENETWAVAASADGKRAAAVLSTPGKQAYRMWLTVWDVESGKKVAEVPTQERSGGWERIAFAPDGKSAAVRVAKIYFVDLEAGRVTGTLDDPDDRLHELRYVADGKFLFVSGERSFALWDVKSRSKLTWEDTDALGDTASLNRRALSADGRTLVLAGPDEVRSARLTLPTKEGGRVRVESVKKFKTTGAPKWQLAVAADGSRFAVADTLGVVHRFEFKSREPMGKLSFRHRAVGLHCSADSALAAERGDSDYSRRIHVWDLDGGKEITAAQNLRHADGPASWSADGKEIIAGSDRWDPATGKHLGAAKAPAPPKAWKTPDGRPGVLSRDGRTAIVSVIEGKETPPRVGDSRLMILPAVKAVEVWDVVARKPRGTFRDKVMNLPRISNYITGGQYRLSDDGRIFAAADYTILHIWDTASGRLLLRLDLTEAGLEQALDLDFSPDGRRLLVAAVKGAAVVDVAARGIAFKTTRAPKPHGWNTGRFSPDGRRIALAGGGSKLLVLDVTSGEAVVDRDTGHTGLAYVAFRPDGRQLLTRGSAGWCLVWDVPPPAPPKAIAGDEMGAAWEKLANKDPAMALKWVGRWAASGDAAVAFLGKRLRPEDGFPADELRKLVADLASPKFREREAARKRLQEIGEPIVARLRAEAARAADPEVAEGLRKIVDHPDRPLAPPTPDTLRGLRALEALERIGTPEALAVIERVAKGAEGMPLTEEARATMGRLSK